MQNRLRGLHSVRTAKNKVCHLRAKTPHWIMAELAALKAEAASLRGDAQRCERELEQIGKRLKEIKQAEEWLSKSAQIISDNGGGGEEKRRSNLLPPLSEMVIKY